MGGWNKFGRNVEPSIYSENNELHIQDYLDLFKINEIFECQENRISKSQSWVIIEENKKYFFKKGLVSYYIINCDIDDASSW